MSINQYVIANPDYSYIDGSADSTANSEGFIVVNGSTIRLVNHRAPATATDPGLQGEICIGQFEGQYYLFVCVAANTWRTVPLSSFISI